MNVAECWSMLIDVDSCWLMIKKPCHVSAVVSYGRWEPAIRSCARLEFKQGSLWFTWRHQLSWSQFLLGCSSTNFGKGCCQRLLLRLMSQKEAKKLSFMSCWLLWVSMIPISSWNVQVIWEIEIPWFTISPIFAQLICLVLWSAHKRQHPGM